MNLTTRRFLIIIGMVSIISTPVWMCWSIYTRHSEPPPGWTIVTDGHGNYAPKDMVSGYVFERVYGQWGYGMSRQRAINRAWKQHEFRLEKAERDSKWKSP